MPDSTTRYINAAQVVVFSPTIADTLKADILHSALLAQLLADKAPFTTLSNWHHSYTSALARTHWVRTSNTIHTLTPDGPNVTPMDLIEASALSAYEKTVLGRVLNALRQPVNAQALAIFRKAVYKPHGQPGPKNLWFELVQVTEASDIQTCSLSVEAPGPILTLDWSGSAFDVVPEGSIVKVRSAHFELAPAYDGIRTKVIKALGDKPSHYMSTIEGDHDVPDTPVRMPPATAPDAPERP